MLRFKQNSVFHEDFLRKIQLFSLKYLCKIQLLPFISTLEIQYAYGDIQQVLEYYGDLLILYSGFISIDQAKFSCWTIGQIQY